MSDVAGTLTGCGGIDVVAGSPTVGRRRLGLILRRLREDAHLSGEEAGERLDRSGSWISRVEGAKIGLRPRELRDLLAVYGVNDAPTIEKLAELARSGKEKGWWSGYAYALSAQLATYVGFEAGASEIDACEALIVHGLLQTPDYARAIFRSGRSQLSDEEVNRQVDVRLERQRLLTGEDPPQYWCILDESALRRMVGGPGVMRAQLARLREVSELPNVTLQVLPFAGGAEARMVGSFTLLRFSDDADEDVVYVETLTGEFFPEAPDVRRYRFFLEHLRAAAASPNASVKLIEDAQRALA